MKHNVVVCGRSHTGKSSLAQHIAGDGTCTFGLMPIKAESLAEGQSPASYATTIELAAHRELERLAPGSTPKVHCYWLCVDAAQGATEVDKALFATLKDRALLVATKTDLLSQEGIDRLHANLKEFAPDDRIVLHSNQSCGPAKLGRLTSAIAMANAGDDYAKELLAELAEEAAKEAEEDKSPDNDFTLKDYMHMRGDCLRTQAKEKADKFVYWAAGRAFTIAFVKFFASFSIVRIPASCCRAFKLE